MVQREPSVSFRGVELSLGGEQGRVGLVVPDRRPVVPHGAPCRVAGLGLEDCRLEPIAPGPGMPLPKTVILLVARASMRPSVPGEPTMLIIGAIGTADVSVRM